VMPEVDVPGHAAAAIAAYPELGNSDVPGWYAPKKPPMEWGVHDWTLAPKNDTLAFLQKVFDTVGDLFPAPWVHIGGDEAKTQEWQRSHQARSFMEQGASRVSGNVQSYFNEQVAELVRTNKRSFVSWDETQHIGGLPSDAIVMAWRSSNECKFAVSHGRRLINADQGVYYFDHYQGPEHLEPKAFGGGHITLEQVYNADPMPRGLTKEEQELVLGGQGQLWSEWLPSWKQVEYMAFPRSLALAERLWTPPREIQGFPEFKQRLKPRLEDLDHKGVNYRHLD